MNFFLGNTDYSIYSGYRPYGYCTRPSFRHNFFVNTYDYPIFIHHHFDRPMFHHIPFHRHHHRSSCDVSDFYRTSLMEHYSIEKEYDSDINSFNSFPFLNFSTQNVMDEVDDFIKKTLESFETTGKTNDVNITKDIPVNEVSVSGSVKKEKSNLESYYNQEKARYLAIIAGIKAQELRSQGKCAKGVNDVLELAGLVEKNSTRRESAYQLTEPFDRSSSLRKVTVPREDLKNLPKGCIIVWQRGNGENSPSKEHGHVCITLGNGKEASDDVRNLKIYDTEYSVYVPV